MDFGQYTISVFFMMVRNYVLFNKIFYIPVYSALKKNNC